MSRYRLVVELAVVVGIAIAILAIFPMPLYAGFLALALGPIAYLGIRLDLVTTVITFVGVTLALPLLGFYGDGYDLLRTLVVSLFVLVCSYPLFRVCTLIFGFPTFGATKTVESTGTSTAR